MKKSSPGKWLLLMLLAGAGAIELLSIGFGMLLSSPIKTSISPLVIVAAGVVMAILAALSLLRVVDLWWNR